MAELSVKSNDKKKQALRVDLTPMVDLGFLLISFFIFTTTMSTQTMVKLVLPADSTDSSKIGATGAVTIIPTDKQLKVYNGNDWQHSTNFGAQDFTGIRSHLLQCKKELRQRYGNEEKLFVILMPHASSHFGQLIGLFDELKICDIKRYALSELTKLEESYVLK
jgi:biopolymer transport protein ExbD